MITLDDLEEKSGLEVSEWFGQCYRIADAYIELTGTGKLIFGFYHHRNGDTVTDHGWVSLPDGTIVDPTRWTMEDEHPYIFYGSPDDCYDVDGVRWEKELDEIFAGFFPEKVTLYDHFNEIIDS